MFYVLENWQISSSYCFILPITVSIAKEQFCMQINA